VAPLLTTRRVLAPNSRRRDCYLSRGKPAPVTRTELFEEVVAYPIQAVKRSTTVAHCSPPGIAAATSARPLCRWNLS